MKILLTLLLLILPLCAKSGYPYDLDIASPVQEAYSDEQSKTFMKESLPSIESLISANSTEKKSLNPNNLPFKSPTFDGNYTVRAYFISEGADWRNTLGYSTTGGSPLDKSAEIIFPNVSTSSEAVRNPAAPLKKGDFVDLGTFSKGQQLDFFLIAKGYTGGSQWFSTTDSLNTDGIKHAVNFGNGGVYTILGFEDILGGGDRDFNDAVIALEYRKVQAPEAANTLILGMVALLLSNRRRVNR